MNREQHIAKAKSLRKGKTTATIKQDEHGRTYSVPMQHASLNQAKRHNGPGAVSLVNGESFPPTLDQLPKIEEPQPEAAAEKPAAAAEAPDPEPDAYDDPQGHTRWLIRQETKQIRAAFDERARALEAENAQLKGYVYGREQRDAVDHRVRAAVEKHSPLIAPLLDHPDFAEAFRQSAASATHDQLSDPVFLASVAGYVAPRLDPALIPKKEPARDEGGRYTAQETYQAGREALARGDYEAGRVPRGGSGPGLQFSGSEAKMMRVLEEMHGPVSAEEWTALDGNSKQYAEQMRRLREKPRGGRR